MYSTIQRKDKREHLVYYKYAKHPKSGLYEYVIRLFIIRKTILDGWKEISL